MDADGTLSGCMGVLPPLFGSGPLSGSSSGAAVSFVVRSTLGEITFMGQRRGDNVSGTYEVEFSRSPTQLGTFILDKVSSDGPGSDFNGQNCPTDAEVDALADQKKTDKTVPTAEIAEQQHALPSAAFPLQPPKQPKQPPIASPEAAPKYVAIGRISCYANERVMLYMDETLTKQFRTLSPGEKIDKVGNMGETVGLTFPGFYSDSALITGLVARTLESST